MKNFSKLAGMLTASLLIAGTANAANVTPDVIFGDGNANGSFTVDTNNGVELGLRAKVRFNASNQPENTFNYDGGSTYTFADGAPAGSGFGFAPNSSSTASWNFEWSINSDVTGSLGRSLDDLTYSLSMDYDPGAGTNFQTFDPVNTSFADHAIGNNSTGNGDGVKATDASGYAVLIAANNVAQNSWNMEFFDSASFPFLNTNNGAYDFVLSAFDGQTLLAQTSITVQVGEVPVPAALPLLLSALGVFGFMRWRKTA